MYLNIRKINSKSFQNTLTLKVNVTSFGRAAFSYSAIQPHFLTSPGQHYACLSTILQHIHEYNHQFARMSMAVMETKKLKLYLTSP